MPEIWTPEQEAEHLRSRFVDVNKKDFAQKHKVPGGPSMLSQHLSGHRPMSLAAAIAYAKGFGVSLAEISPRLAKEVTEASEATGDMRPRSTPIEIAYPSAQWPFEVAQERLQVLQDGDWIHLNSTIKAVVEVRERDLFTRKSTRAKG